MDCPYGNIEIEYERDEEGQDVKMKITVPTSTTGFLLLPTESSSVSIWRMTDGEDKKNVTKTGSRVGLRPGRYRLQLKP